MAVLSHLRDEDARSPPRLFEELRRQLPYVADRTHVAGLGSIHAGDALDARSIAIKDLFQRRRHFADSRPFPHCVDREFQEISSIRGASTECGEGRLDASRIAPGAQGLEPADLVLANRGVVHFESVEILVTRWSVAVDADDDVVA